MDNRRTMTFNELNLSAPLLRAVAEAGYESPSPIQASAIPPVLAGRDLMGCAQTGTGKTAAFALPMLDRLTAAPAKKKGAVRALILTPTRELALQIGESFELYGKYLNQRSTVIFGGVGQAPQVAALKKGVDILIACPGRLNDLVGQGLIDLSHIEIFVLDEADRMLDMGFVHDVKKVIAKLPAQRQNLMFSATMPKEIEQLAAGILHDPAFVKVDPVSSTVDRIDQSLYFVEKGNKKFLLPWLIQNLKPPVQNALVFSRTKHGADKIAKDLNKQGIPAAAIHGNKSQSARVAALEGFKAGNTKVLVATDVAARGLDVDNLTHVINYNLPEDVESYTHRSGRTGRAGREGVSVAIINSKEKGKLRRIENILKKKFQYKEVPGGEEVCRAQLSYYADKILMTEPKETLDKYRHELFEKFEELSKEELIQKMMSYEFGKLLKKYASVADLNLSDEERHDGGRGEKRRGERKNEESVTFTTFSVNVGKEDGFTPRDLMTIINENGKDWKSGVSAFSIIIRNLKSMCVESTGLCLVSGMSVSTVCPLRFPR